MRRLAADAVELDADRVGLVVDPLFEVAAVEDLSGDPFRRAEQASHLGLKTAAMLHVVASTPNFPLANDCTYYGLEDDVITPLHRIDRGRLPVPEGHGLGVTVDEAKVAKYRV